MAYPAMLALASRVLSKNDKNEGVSNAKDLGMMNNNTNCAQILCMTSNGFLLDHLKQLLYLSPL